MFYHKMQVDNLEQMFCEKDGQVNWGNKSNKITYSKRFGPHLKSMEENKFTFNPNNGIQVGNKKIKKKEF